MGSTSQRMEVQSCLAKQYSHLCSSCCFEYILLQWVMTFFMMHASLPGRTINSGPMRFAHQRYSQAHSCPLHSSTSSLWFQVRKVASPLTWQLKDR